MRRLGFHLTLGAMLSLSTPAAAAWRTAWMAAPFPTTPVLVPDDLRVFERQTVRQTIRVATGGTRLRLRLSNELGGTAVRFAAVHVAKLDADGRTIAGSDRAVTFATAAGADIPAGAPLVSDAFALPVAPLDRLAISVVYRDRATPVAHLLRVAVGPGDQGSAATLANAVTARAPAIVAALELNQATDGPLIVAIGDSITEGAGSTPGTFRGWPDRLAERFAARPAKHRPVIVNAGISGNRVLRDGAGPNLLARFDRDVLAVPGATHVILMEGINDIGNGEKTGAPVSAAELIAAYGQAIARAHAAGLRIIGATLTPYRGAAYFTPAGEVTRQAVNRWIRTGGAFDGVIDFDRVVVDPADPSRIRAAFHPGDHLHPNDAGYAAMAAAIDPALFTR
ncbi:SGNH/GDSL hydrolase family protein [Sphingomonas montana]|uniref:SGNH/GDSL hydrolase family protein n=1 Tax=Sphingomonas montana TaxID=1843236 RepID=UPI00096BF31E|nr:SGNH/GDSL hydrolase family protein [Sphingomonas montana]